MPPLATSDATRNRLLAVATAILVVAALKLARPVLVPLVTAVFLIILAWPLQVRVERRLPRSFAYLVTMTAILLASAVVAGAFVFSLDRVVDVAPELARRLEALWDAAAEWARARRLPVPLEGDQRRELLERVGPLLAGVLAGVYAAAGLVALVAAFLLLGLLEVRAFHAKVERRLRPRVGDALLETTRQIAVLVRRHLLALTITSAISGAATGLYAWATGLDLAVVWGFTTFLLNYIPTLGPAASVVPPTLFALLQFDDLSRPLLVFVGLAATQLVMGNVVDPKIEGRVLSLSPVGVLLGLVFWAWLWGVPGAFLAVPLTVALVIVSRQFAATRWIAELLSELEEEEEGTG